MRREEQDEEKRGITRKTTTRNRKEKPGD